MSRAASIGKRLGAVLAQARGEAILFEDRWYDWTSLRRTADGLAAALATVAPACAVAQVVRNRPLSIGALLGLLRDGRSILQVSPIQPPAAIAEEMRRLRPAVIVAEADDWTMPLREVAAELGTIGVSLDGDRVNRVAGWTVAQGDDHATCPHDVGIMMPTSGTTGPPKRVPIPAEQLETYRADKDDTVVESDRVVIVAGPVFTVTGLRPMLSWATRPMRMALMERVDVERWARLVKAYRPREGGLPPAAMRMLLDSDVPRDSLASLQGWYTGSAPVDPDVAERFEAEFGVPVLVAYGATEFGGPVTRMTPEDRQAWGNAKRGSSGRAIPGNDLRIVSREDGRELARGESGLLEVSAARTGGEWVRTNDIARIDADGFLYIEGRADDVIIRGGFKVPLGEVEAKLETHPQVAQASVLAENDERLGQVPVAAIVPREGSGLTAPEIEAWARETLAPYKRPVRFVVLPALPMTASMKVNRPELRRLMGEGVEI
jgi:acyl-coenzyme A synthetase/AMP-(fatty) acid ligase